ncbi:hypothetical protein QL285_001738 [Trifolium repens]|nr:hypothetical protein QL285_001738 [Trifolium repens]
MSQIKNTHISYWKEMLYDDPWKIKKVLQDSDLDDKLMLDKDLAEELVLPVLAAGSDVERETLVTIFDSNTESRHVLVFKRC